MFTNKIEVVDVAVCGEFFPGLATMGILRLDLPDPVSGGNKSFKLKYHIEAFRVSRAKHMLSFGGAYSNHIAALAAAGRKNSVSTIGIIRGDELNAQSNKMLSFALSCGMQLVFVSRDEYKRRYDDRYFAELKNRFGEIYIVPEGGSGEEGIRGCMEIPGPHTDPFDVIVLPYGTGATKTGISRAAKKYQEIVGIDVVNPLNSESLGGYAKTTPELEEFMKQMKEVLDLPLDHVYSGKTLYAIHQKTTAGYFRGKNLLFVHTGGYAFNDGGK